MLTSCNLSTTAVSEVQSETRTVNLDSASSASVQIEFDAGELNVVGGADSLMDGNFRYNVNDWHPQVDYSENGEQGQLLITHRGDRVPVGGELINEWNLQFSNEVPLELTIQTGNGESQLDLAALNLTAVTIETGAGVTDIDLNGNWQHDLPVSVSGGVGEITVNLPAEMGVRVNSDTALVSVTTSGLTKVDGGYVNDAYQTAPYALTLDLQTGIGSVILDASE
jgi:hypothetical protein